MTMYKTAIFHNFQVPEKKTCFTNMDEVKKYIYEYNHPVESIGFDNQIKPVFDIDLKIEKNFVFEENTSLSKWCQIIKKMFEAAPKIQIYILKRPSRDFKGLIKHSYHIIVDGIRISHGNLKKLVKNAELSEEWDTCIYSDKRGLYPIYSSKKYNRNTGLIEDVSMFKPYDCFEGYLDDDKIDITKYLPSYIEEDFIDWDEKMKTEHIIEKKLQYKFIETDDDDEPVKDGSIQNKLYEYINVLSSKRATQYDTWRDVVYAISNICKRFNISNRIRVDIIHTFSQKSKDYDETQVDKWLETNKFAEKGYGWNYIKNTCIKEDDPVYYEKLCEMSITGNEKQAYIGKIIADYIKMNGNTIAHNTKSCEELVVEDDRDACEIILKKYGDMMVNCDNVYYVKNNNIWTCRERTVNNVIYNWIMDTDMKIMVGKNTYKYYNRSKTNVNKCLEFVIQKGFKHDNKTFLSDNQRASKDYLPFKDGVYSFLEKKLLPYEKVPVQFTVCIDRNFPQFDENSHKTLMEKIIIPILPIEEEREYFMYELARALSGHFEDKKWFINRGSRNSGKGVITKLLQNAFMTFIGIFNSGAFVLQKNEGADVAKNLSWIVGKRDCRLFISNEIKENATLNGILIKGLSSGGDTVVGRTNYKDEMDFTPQFMMMFMCNNLKDIEPPDALENCVQFYCKSKFVPKEELIEGQPFLKLRDDTIKGLIETPEIIDAFTLYLLNAFKTSMKVPDCVKASTEDVKKDMPKSLERIILKHFRTSTNKNDKLFTDQIIKYIENECDYGSNVNPKELCSILIKCNIGSRKDNGKISIDGIKRSGYEYITYVPPDNSDINSEDD